jgi:hypothetical protein
MPRGLADLSFLHTFSGSFQHQLGRALATPGLGVELVCILAAHMERRAANRQIRVSFFVVHTND